MSQTATSYRQENQFKMSHECYPIKKLVRSDSFDSLSLISSGSSFQSLRVSFRFEPRLRTRWEVEASRQKLKFDPTSPAETFPTESVKRQQEDHRLQSS